MQLPLMEAFADARRAILPVIEGRPELEQLVERHQQLDSAQLVKTHSHSCGGTYHLAGKVPGFPKYLFVCDSCGAYYHSN